MDFISIGQIVISHGQKKFRIHTWWVRETFYRAVDNGYKYASPVHLSLIFIVGWQIGAPRGQWKSLLFSIPETAAKLIFVCLAHACLSLRRLNQAVWLHRPAWIKIKSEYVYVCRFFFFFLQFGLKCFVVFYKNKKLIQLSKNVLFKLNSSLKTGLWNRDFYLTNVQFGRVATHM